MVGVRVTRSTLCNMILSYFSSTQCRLSAVFPILASFSLSFPLASLSIRSLPHPAAHALVDVCVKTQRFPTQIQPTLLSLTWKHRIWKSSGIFLKIDLYGRKRSAIINLSTSHFIEDQRFSEIWFALGCGFLTHENIRSRVRFSYVSRIS